MRASEQTALPIVATFSQGVHMKKLFIIAAFAFVVSLAASSAMGRGDTRNDPNQQQGQQQDQQQREKWQRDQWQKEQDQHNQRHEQTQTYDVWLRGHSHDYDNRR
jgi:Ni/Co efflux regulator RcnB